VTLWPQNEGIVALPVLWYASNTITSEIRGVSQETRPRQVLIYADETGKEPFKDGLYGLRDVAGRQRILARLSRLAPGNWGDCAPVGDGVSELRLFFGPGYRVYFGEQGGTVVMLLCGGDKSSQSRDIEQAKIYWKEYLDHEEL